MSLHLRGDEADDNEEKIKERRLAFTLGLMF
jgi:hypothetical protein